MNPDNLRHQKLELKKKHTTLELMIKNNIHSRIDQFESAITCVYGKSVKIYDFRAYLFKLIIQFLHKIIEHNKTLFDSELNSILFDINFYKQKIFYQDRLISLYCLRLLKENILINEKGQDSEKRNKDDTVIAHIDLLHKTITFVNKEAILICISFKTGNHSLHDKIMELFSEPFKVSLDFTEMKFWVFKEIIDKQLDLFMNYSFRVQNIEILNSFKLLKERGSFTLIETNNILNEQFVKYSEEKIKLFLDEIESIYTDCKIRGLVISYFYILNPGLIEYMDTSKYKDTGVYYYLKWMDIQ